MKKFLRKLTSFAMALFMVLQVMLPAFATKSKAEEENPNSIKSIENLNPDDETYFSITDSQKIYDKKKIKKDESKFSIAIGLPDTSSNFKLVKRNDLKLYDDELFPTNEEASKEYWRVKDMLNDQGLDTDLEIIKEDQGYRIINKENLENEKEEKQYGENYSYINFKILDDFDFNEKGNQKLLNQEKLVFNLEFITNISPDPNYNLFEKDEEGKWKVKNEGDIFALVNNDKVNVYDTSFLANDLNSLKAYKEEKRQAEEKAKKEAEEKKKAEEEAKKAEEEKKLQEEKEKAEAEKKAQEEKEKAEAAKKAEEEKKAQEKAKKAEEEKKAQEEAKENSQAENKENQKEEKSVLETDNTNIKDKKSSDQKSLIEKKQDKPEESLTMTNLEKADKELKEALKDENNSIGDIQKLLTNLVEKYKLSRLDQEKLMSENDKAIRDLVEKDRNENFRPNMLRALQGNESNSFADKTFHLKATMNVKATDINPIPTGWYFDVKVGPYLYYSSNQPLNDLYFTGLGLVATAQYIEDGLDHYIRYTFIKPVTKDISLDIDQNLKFDTANIGSNQSVDIDIKVSPKNNPVQSMKRKTVNINDPPLVESSFTVEDQGNTQSGTYPYQLNWKTNYQKLMNSSGSIIADPTSENTLEGAYVEWYIEVDTSSLVDENNKLDFEKLNLTVFGSSKQGLKNISYRFANTEDDLATKPSNPTSDLGELRSGNSSIAKKDLGKKLIIKVRGEIDPNQLHESYSIGFRINPDKNYIDKLLKDIIDKYNNIPLPPPLKWLNGVEDAKRFAEVPFNLVETNIPATFNGLSDRFNNERFYYDNTRTIVAKRIDDTKADWYALDLIRRGETQDTSLDNPTFYKNRINLETKNVNTTKVYYVPLKDGGYRKTYQPGDAILSSGQYYPGTIISYEYKTQKAGRNDTYYLRADLKEKKKFNVDQSYQTEGGRVDLFTEKVSDQALANGYLAYTENPYPIMRINRNFDMVSCFNDNVAAPVYEGNNKGVFLDIHEDPSGTYLISRLNESIANKDYTGYKLREYLNGTKLYENSISLNHNGLNESQAMEELMKKIYFYGEEVKKEYANNEYGGNQDKKEMHRLIESSMYQRVIHHFTDGKSLAKDYFDVPSDYNVDEWKVDYTLTGRRKTGTEVKFEDSFDGKDATRKHDSGARKLKDNETRIKDYPPVQRTQYAMAQKLYKKVIDSYRDGNTWNDDKADSVKLVFYSHTDEGKYQELITGRVTAPIQIDKYKKVGDELQKLPGAEFTFTNINTGQSKTWTSTNDNNSHSLYLRPGTYRVQETTTPDGYEKIKDFDIIVQREEINGDDGPYKFKKLPKIHVNDGFNTKVTLGKNLPKSTDGTKLVTIDNGNIKVSVTNLEDNLGKLEFTKKNKFVKLFDAEFSLRKIKTESVQKAKDNINSLTDADYDSIYDQSSKGSYGDYKFEQIPAGFYVLEETGVPSGYEKAPLYLLEGKLGKVDGKDKVVLSFVGDTKPETENGKTIIRNNAKETTIKFRKVRSEHVGDLEHEHLGLADAKFRLMSINMIDGDFYLQEGYTDHSKATEEGTPRVDGQQARGGGYITFEGLKTGEYLLEELQAPKGYKKTDLYGWKLVVSEIKEGENKGELEYKLYEIPKGTNVNEVKTSDLKKVKLDDLINGNDKIKAFQIGNESRKISIPFDKYLTDGTTDPVKANKKLVDDTGNPVEFDLYKADYYGAIIGDKINNKPIVQNIAKTDSKDRIFKDPKYDYSFELHDLEFGGYYVLKEKNPPAGYKTASSILLKVEAEAIANEGHMKVIVRDPNPNAKTDDHSIFFGVIDFEKKTKLGEFSIKKVGKAIGYEGNVGLRRAYFRLYTADKNFEIEYKDPDKKYPKEYIQKVTPGVPITHEEGGKQVGTDPSTLPKNQGIVTFDQLKPGNYVLEEYRGPAGYEKDPGKWYITVDQYGTVKKYREKPGTGSRQVLYSMQNPRYKMSGLNISENLPINRLMGPQTFTGLEAFENSYSENNLNIKVSGNAVDTSNGKRTIDISISPQDVPGQGTQKNLQYVFLIDRSQDTSTKGAADAPTIDKNTNKFLTDLAKKAKDNNAKVDVTFIEYSRSVSGNYGTANKNKTKLLGSYNQDLVSLYEKAKTFKYNMKTQSFNEVNPVDAKDILGQVGISTRETITKSKDDGSRGLSENINTHYNQIISNGKKYDKRIVLNIANFEAASADFYYEVPNNPRSQKKYYIADNNWPFRDPGKQDKDKIFDSYVLHIEQKSSQETDYEKYMRTNSGTWYIDKNENPQQGLFTYKNFLESNLLKDEYFKASQKDGYLIKGATLNLSLNSRINLISASANVTDASGQTIIKNLTPTTSKVEQFHSISLANIDLKKNESLKLSYTIDLKNTADYNTSYYINKDKITFTNGTKETYISRINPNTGVDIMTKKIKATPNNYNVTLESTGNGNVTVDKATGLSEGTDVTITTTPKQGYKLNELKVINLKTNEDITVTNNKFKMPAANVKVTATFVAEGGQSTYSIRSLVQPIQGGTLSVSPSSGIAEGNPIAITAKPTIGYKLVELKAVADNNPSSELELREYMTRSAFNTTDEVTRYFSMPASNVIVTAEFVPIGKMNIKANFTYTNQTDGKDDSEKVPEGFAGKLKLQVNNKNQTVDNWVEVQKSENLAPYKGTIDFNNLDREKEYRLVYTRDENIAGAWGTEHSTEIPIDFTKADKNNTVTVNISNGNLMEIFNKDETGFRIPLRITKVNENKGALTGSQFKARKILNGDKSLYKEINKKIVKTGESKDYPIYHDEKFDGVSEATGEPGDNYFRELTPGIYELTEIKAPDGTYRIPKDENGKPMKWYFQVFVYEGRDPRGADYMGINFNFEHTFTDKDDFNKDNVNEAEKAKLIGTTIEGLGSDKAKFNKYIKVIPDDGRSNPARPDAPYQGINDAQVTNYKSKTNLSFFKKDLETHKNLKDAEFTLRKVKIQTVDENGKKVEKPVLGTDNKPEYADDKTTDDKGKEYTDDQLKDLMVQPYHKDKDKVYALAKSTENLGVEFTNIEEGTYILEETTPAKGYKPTDSFLTITFTEAKDGSWKQVVTGYKKDSTGKYVKTAETDTFFSKDKDGKLVSIANQKKYINFKFHKIRARKGENEEKINTASFKLTQVDKDGNPLPGAKQWNVQNNFTSNEFNFTNLGVGRYKLEETKVIDEFEKPDPWYFNVKDDEENPGKLKIEFEKRNGHTYNSISFKPYDNSGVRPQIDEKGNPVDMKVKNFSRIKFKFQKLSDQTDANGNKLPLKDALFRLKKVRYSTADKAKAYEYYENDADESKNGALKKYSHGDQVTEFYETGIRKKFTKGTNVYEFDKKGDLIKVNGIDATQQDKADLTNRKVIPDSVSAATGKYYSTMRSQSDGGVTFDELGEGIYELTETKIPEGYQSSNRQFSWIFEVKKTKDGLVIEHNKDLEKTYYKTYGTAESAKYYKPAYTDNTNVKKSGANNFSYEITNTKTTTDLKWKKITNFEKGKLIQKRTQFWLFKVSDDPTDPKIAESGQSSFAPYQVESSNGNFEINDLSKGIYTLVETIEPEGYKKMQRQIVIQIYEDKDDSYKLKQNFYEMKREKVDGKDKNVLVENPADFTNLLTRKQKTEVDADIDASGNKTFYVNNEAKPQYFYLSKGFMKNEKGKDVFTDITKGELKIKIYADPADTNNKDTNIYEKTIKLSDDKSYKIDVDGIKTGVDYLLEEVESPDGFSKTKNKYKIRFESVNNQLIPKLMAVIEPDGNILKGTKNVKQNRTEDGEEFSPTEGYLINGPKDGTGPLRIVNKKTEIEFTKYGKDKVTDASGDFKDQYTPLGKVEFYLEKQDPTDREYYPLNENMELIKPADTATAKKYTSDADGKFKITNLTDGYYRVMEPTAPKDSKGEPYMKINGPVKTFRVVGGEILIADKDDKTGRVSEVQLTDENKKRLGKIINEKPGKGEFDVKKYDDLGSPMAGVDFKLTDTSADEVEKAKGTTDSEGKIHFTDLPFGYYWLVETQTKGGYILNTKKKLVSLGGDKKWNVPNKNTDVSSKIKFATNQKDLESTSGDKNNVYPNKEEAILARFKLDFADPKEIKPGNYFTLKLSDNVDIDGIVKDKDGNGKSDVSNLNIIGPAGLLAKADVDKDRRTITYTFTDYVGDYTPTEMELFLQLYPNREMFVTDKSLTLNANIGASTYNKSIDIKYRGYQDSTRDVSSYMLRLEPDGKTFTAIVYYNQWNRNLTDKGIEFFLDKNVVEDSLKVTTYKKLDEKGKALAGSHSDGYKNGDLPDSYGIDPDKDKLTKVGEDYTLSYRTLYNLFGDRTNTTYPTITLPYGYLNKGYYVDQKIDNTVNNDPMDTTYVIEIKGKLADKNVKSLKTHVQYNHKRNLYESYYYYGRKYQRLVGNYYAGAFKTWSQFYTPGASGNASKEMQVINFRNRIDFVKVDGGVMGEVPETVPDDQGKTYPSSIFANDRIGDGLKGAKFKLKKDGQDLANSEVTSDDLGRFSWVALAPGKYEVWETEAPKGYKLPTDEKGNLEKAAAFTVHDDGQITLDTGFKEIIANKKTSKIRIRKVDQDGKPIPGENEKGEKIDTQAGFSLVGANNKKVEGWNNLTKYTNIEGYALFEDIPAGNFELKETETPKGYTPSGKTWNLTVGKDGRMAWTNSFDDTKDILKQATYNQTGTAYANLDTKIVGIDKTKKVFRQYNLIKATKTDLKDNKVTITSPDANLKLNAENTKIRLVALEKDSSLANPTPATDEADYKVSYNTNSMEVSIILPEEKQSANKPVGQGPNEEENKLKTYLIIVDMPYSENSKVGAKISYKTESVDKTVDGTSITEGNENHSLGAFKNENKDYYRPRLVNDLDFVIENIEKPDIYFKKVDEKDNTIALAGAEFELQKKNEKGEYVTIGQNGNAPGLGNPKWIETSKADGHFGFSNIPDGEYQIFETKAPDGYALVEKIVFKFVVKNGKIEYKDNDDKNIPKNELNLEDKTKEYSEKNRILITNKKAQYPSTGGPGVWIGFTVIGMLVMFVAVLTYSKRRDKLKV